MDPCVQEPVARALAAYSMDRARFCKNGTATEHARDLTPDGAGPAAANASANASTGARSCNPRQRNCAVIRKFFLCWK